MNARQRIAGAIVVLCGCAPVAPSPVGDAPPEAPRRPVVLAPAAAVPSSPPAGRCPAPERRDEAPWDLLSLGPAVARTSERYDLTDGGVAVADLDGDGHLDLFLPGELQTMIFAGDGRGAFADVTPASLAGGAAGASSATAADYDADGDLDLLVTRFGGAPLLLRNDGAWRFVDVSAASGLTPPPARAVGSAWGDWDGDGDLDVFLASYGSPVDPERPEPDYDLNFLFENVGDGTFVDRSGALPEVGRRGYTFLGGWHDLDSDGAPELVVLNDLSSFGPDVLLWNDGGRLIPDPGRMGFSRGFNGMGLGVGDVNDDGVPDLLQSSARTLSLRVSHGDAWVEEAQARGLSVRAEPPESQLFGWGAELADVDLDGRLDAVVGFGTWSDYDHTLAQQDALFLQGELGAFTDAAASWGVASTGATRGLVVADLNEDGWPDLVKRVLHEPAQVALSRCGDRSWLAVSLRGAGPNTAGVGAVVTVTAGDRTWRRWITAGGTSMFSGGPPDALFGLADVERVDALEVAWPSGARSRWEDLPARLRVVAREPR